MYIKDTMIGKYDRFTVDTDKIGLCSVSRKDVELPYTGPLPCRTPVSSAFIRFNIQPVQEPSAVLKVVSEGGKKTPYILSFGTDEVMVLLDRFFSQESGCGMEDFYFGHWRGLYTAWRRAVTSPKSLIPLLLSIPERDKQYIKARVFG